MRGIKYVAYYNTSANAEEHELSPAACSKVSYIIKAINSKNINVDVISASRSAKRKGQRQTVKKLNDHATLTLLRDLKGGSWLSNKVATMVYTINLVLYLLFNLQRTDTVIVYHSLLYMSIIRFAKKVKGFKLVLEVEEIYGDVLQEKSTVEKEICFFTCADAYIFPTDLLNKRINVEGKPYVVIHGTYQIEGELEHNLFGMQDKKQIHCVYAGTLDPRKGGALAAASAAEYLTDDYHMHILGFGSGEDTERIKKHVEELIVSCKCELSYDGCLSGAEYLRFIQSCDIGLSTQNPAATFNDTSFPSKILSYLANGLHVVSARISAVETSAVSDLICYYDEQTPEQIAKAICRVNLQEPYDSRKRIIALDEECQSSLVKLLDTLT